MMRWGFVVSMVSLSVMPLAPAAGQPPARNGWHASLEAGRAAARQSGKPLLVVFRCEP